MVLKDLAIYEKVLQEMLRLLVDEVCLSFLYFINALLRLKAAYLKSVFMLEEAVEPEIF